MKTIIIDGKKIDDGKYVKVIFDHGSKNIQITVTEDELIINVLDCSSGPESPSGTLPKKSRFKSKYFTFDKIIKMVK